MHTEISFEDAIEDSLTEQGGYIKGEAAEYDKASALFPADVIDFIKASQPALYQRIEHGQKGKTDSYILTHLQNALDVSGSLNVLRHGFNCYGKIIKMAYFAPNTSINATM